MATKQELKNNSSLIAWLSTLEEQLRLAVAGFAEKNCLTMEEVTDILTSTHLFYISETGRCEIMPKGCK